MSEDPLGADLTRRLNDDAEAEVERQRQLQTQLDDALSAGRFFRDLAVDAEGQLARLRDLPCPRCESEQQLRADLRTQWDQLWAVVHAARRWWRAHDRACADLSTEGELEHLAAIEGLSAALDAIDTDSPTPRAMPDLVDAARELRRLADADTEWRGYGPVNDAHAALFAAVDALDIGDVMGGSRTEGELS